MKATLSLSLLILAGCGGILRSSGEYRNFPPNPYVGLHKIAVWPVDIGPGVRMPIDTQTFGQLFCTEMALFRGFEVIRPDDVAQAAVGRRVESIPDALALARELKADAILALKVTDFDPYDPPRISVSVQLLSTGARERSVEGIDRLTTSGTWVFKGTKGDAGHVAAMFELVRDARDDDTRDRIEHYRNKHWNDDDPWKPGPGEFLIGDRFLQYVSNDIVREMIRHAPPAPSAVEGPPPEVVPAAAKKP